MHEVSVGVLSCIGGNSEARKGRNKVKEKEREVG